MTDQATVQIRFTVPAQNGYESFTDALYLSFAEYAAATVDSLAAAKAARYSVWTALIDAARNAPPPDPPATGSLSLLQAAIMSVYEEWASISHIAGAAGLADDLHQASPVQLEALQQLLSNRGFEVTLSDLTQLTS